MVYLATLLLLLEACSFSGAASIYSPRRSKKSFTLEQIPTSRTRARRSTPDDHGSVSAADISKDNEYIVPVTIGGSTLNLQLDTGSSDLWVFSNETKSAKGHTYYKPGKHAQKIENGTWDISYSDNDFCFGDVWLDSVTIGGLTYDKQGVEAAKIASPGLVADRDSDGILGLSFSDENTAIPKQKNFFANIIDELEEPVFTASLKHNAPGSYDFGFIDKSKYTGEIKYVD
ncbi:Type I transmembrane sorting receptor, partial [Ascosphaera atra]